MIPARLTVFALALAAVPWTGSPAAQATSDAVGVTAARSAAEDQVRLRIITGDHDPPENLRLYLIAGEAQYGAPIAPDGRLAFRIPASAPDTLILIVDAVEPRQRRYHPAFLRLTREQLTEEVRLVLVPYRWTIERGRFAGQTLRIGMREAFMLPSPSDTASFYPRIRVGHGVPVYQNRFWPPEFWPIPVAFRHNDNAPLEPRDSTRFWREVERLHADLGRELFKPAQFDDAVRESYMIQVQVDPTITSAGLGGAAGSLDRGYVSGTVTFQDQDLLSDHLLVVHELLHALGFGHTCAWESVLSGAQCPNRESARMTRQDVAYFEVRFRIWQLKRENDAPYGLLEALNGERVLVRRSPPEAGTLPPDVLRSSYRSPPGPRPLRAAENPPS